MTNIVTREPYRYTIFHPDGLADFANWIGGAMVQNQGFPGLFARYYINKHQLDQNRDFALAIVLVPQDGSDYELWYALAQYIVSLRRRVLIVDEQHLERLGPGTTHGWVATTSDAHHVAIAKPGEGGAKLVANVALAIALKHRLLEEEPEHGADRAYAELTGQWATRLAQQEARLREKDEAIAELSQRVADYHEKALQYRRMTEALVGGHEELSDLIKVFVDALAQAGEEGIKP